MDDVEPNRRPRKFAQLTLKRAGATFVPRIRENRGGARVFSADRNGEKGRRLAMARVGRDRQDRWLTELSLPALELGRSIGRSSRTLRRREKIRTATTNVSLTPGIAGAADKTCTPFFSACSDEPTFRGHDQGSRAP